MTDEPDYATGKCCPPVHSRWKPGQSGNLKGRPKKAKSGIPHEKVLGRRLTLVVDGIPTEMRADKALVLRIFQKAAEGGRVSVGKVVRRALVEYQTRERRSRRPTIVFQRHMLDGEVELALEHLGMATRIDRYRPSCPLLLEPWIVEAAVALRGDNALTVEEQQRVYSCTRTPTKCDGRSGGI